MPPCLPGSPGWRCPAIATLALAAQDGGSLTGDWMPWALVAVLAAGGMLAFDVLRLRRGLGLAALGCFGGLALWSGLSAFWAWLPGEAATEASRTLFYAAAFAIVLLAVRTQRDGGDDGRPDRRGDRADHALRRACGSPSTRPTR